MGAQKKAKYVYKRAHPAGIHHENKTATWMHEPMHRHAQESLSPKGSMSLHCNVKNMHFESADAFGQLTGQV